MIAVNRICYWPKQLQTKYSVACIEMEMSSRYDGRRRRTDETSSSSHGHGVAGVVLSNEDVLVRIFCFLEPLDIARAQCVCKLWHDIVERSSEWKHGYYMTKLQRGFIDQALPELATRGWVMQLARHHHKQSLLNGCVRIHGWKGHPKRVNCCRSRMESIITGVGDQMVRVWSLSNYKCLEEYSTVNKPPLVDFDFDESKIVGLFDRGICIWKRHRSRQILGPHYGSMEHANCVCYADPEAVIGCGDGTIRIFDLYSCSFSRIFRQNGGAVSCVSMIDDRLLISGTSHGNIAICDGLCGQNIAFLRSSTNSAGLTCLCVNKDDFQVYAGATSGHLYGWDLRTYKQLWESRISSNVIYSVKSHKIDPSTLAVGGIDGVLRIVDANNGKLLSAYVPKAKMGNIANGMMARCSATRVSCPLDNLPRSIRRPITSVAVGVGKIASTHNDNSIMIWNFGGKN